MKEKEVISGKEYLVENGIYTPILKETPYEEAGGTYKVEMIDNQFEILVPNIEEPEEINHGKLNRWGEARLSYLEEMKPEMLEGMMMRNEVMEHLLAIQQEVEEYQEKIQPGMMESWGITEELKSENQMEWVGLYNNMLSSMREIIQKEIIEK